MRNIASYILWIVGVELTLPEIISPIQLTRTEAILTLLLFIVCGFIIYKKEIKIR